MNEAQNYELLKYSMRLKIGHIIIIVVLALSFINIFLFAKSVILADSIQKLELSTEKLVTQNQRLEQELYASNSSTMLQKKAEWLGFSKQATPVYLDTLQYAQAR